MIIKASENHILFNGEVYAESVRLGTWDSKDNWREVPVEEYKKYLENLDAEGV